jgi:hypothetical protein
MAAPNALYAHRVDTLLALAAALVSLRLTAELVRRHRASRSPALALWAVSLGSFATAAAALAWGSAAGWDERSFRVYYLGGALLTAMLLGAGSLALTRPRLAVPLALVYLGLAVGIAVAEPVSGPFAASAIPAAQDHLDLFPARLLAVAGNSVGTLTAVAVALTTYRRRPLGNTAIIAGIGVAAAGSALSGLGVAASSVSLAAAALLLYVGFVSGGQPRESSHSPPTV